MRFYKYLTVITLITSNIGCGVVKFASTEESETCTQNCQSDSGDEGPTPTPTPNPVPTPVEPPHDDDLQEFKDTLTTAQTSAVDVLFVVDNSGSMIEEQKHISQKLSSFIDKINHLDWRIAITSTDMTGSLDNLDPPLSGWLVYMGTVNGVPYKYLDRNFPNYESVFQDRVHLGANGDSNEQGVRATYHALKRNQTDWIRQEAQLAVIVLSDEDEMSDQSRNLREPFTWSEENEGSHLLEFVKSQYGVMKNFSFHSIVVESEECQVKQRKQLYALAQMGKAYLDLSRLTGGIVGSICSSDYAEELSAMGSAIDTYTDSAVLRCQPVGEVVILDSSGERVPNHVMDRRAIFDKVVPGGETLSITYRCRI